MAERDLETALRLRQQRVAPAVQDSFLRVQQAEALRQHGRFDRAQAICESLLQSCPDYVAALHTLGLVFADQERHRDALIHLVRAVMLNPLSWTALTALAGVYLRLGALEMATQTIERAVAIEAEDAAVLLMLGDIRRAQCEFEFARHTYRRALAVNPDLTEAEIAVGWCCMEMGDDQMAAEVFERVARQNPWLIEPLRALAALPPPEKGIDLLARLERTAPGRGDGEAEFRLSAAYVRSAALERMGQHAAAWQCAKQANRDMHRGMAGRLAQLGESRRLSLAALCEHRERPPRREAARGEVPISLFILGPSRSGKSTLEKLVSRLAGVKRGFENPIVERAVCRTFQLSALPSDVRFGQLPPPAFSLCRRVYRDELARLAPSASIFTNTSSGCIFQAASIATVLERTRFLMMKRNLDDNLLRIYLRQYGEAHAYAYDLKAAREHIRWYDRMIDLVAAKFPGQARIIHYEDMIADPAMALRRAAELCDVPVPDGQPAALAGDPGCAAPYRAWMAAELDA
jgi:tetratricopeptide (TPR) repeat protein